VEAEKETFSHKILATSSVSDRWNGLEWH